MKGIEGGNEQCKNYQGFLFVCQVHPNTNETLQVLVQTHLPTYLCAFVSRGAHRTFNMFNLRTFFIVRNLA